MKKRIVVTQNDIDEGTPNALNCPVAKAFNRAFPKLYVAVIGSAIHLGKFYYPLPSKVEQFVEAFDYHDPVNPIIFYFNYSADKLAANS